MFSLRRTGERELMSTKPMRILHILPQFQPGGGIDKVVINYFRHMDHEKFQFDILCHKCDNASYADEITAAGGHVYVLPEMKPSNLIGLAKRYRQILDERGYDVVHCHMANAAFLYLRLAKQKGIQLRIMHSHQDRFADTWTHSLRNRPLVALGKTFANLNLACSKSAGNFLFKEQQFSILYNAVDTKHFQYAERGRAKFRSQFGYSKDQILFGFVGRLVPQKNPMFLIDIFANIKKQEQFVDAKLVIAGDGELRGEMLSKCEDLGLSDSIIWLGNVTDTNSLYSGLDALLLPSLYEGLPMVLVEAQSSGLPCFVSDSVSEESQITDRVIFAPISISAGAWSELIVQNVNLSKEKLSVRKDFARRVSEAGYGMDEQAIKLSELYTKAIQI